MWYQKSFFKYATAILLVLTITFVAYQLTFLLEPILEFIAIIFLPVLVGGIFYYLFRPIVRYIESYRFSRLVSISMVYLIVISLLVLISIFIVPFFIEQVTILTQPPKLQAVKETTTSILKIPYIDQFFRTNLQKFYDWLSSNLVLTITEITKFTVLIFVTPFILFYFLKDDQGLHYNFIKNLPIDYQEDAKLILSDIDSVLSSFFITQALLALIMGVVLFIGYSIIGLGHAFILSLFAALFYTIPMIGSILSLIPALLVGLSVSEFMAIKVVIVMLAAWFLEANVISPQLMAQRLHIHPVVFILLLLAAGALYGVLGLFLAAPVFALVRVLISDFIKIRQRKLQKE